jgi:hypothetical protein
MVILESQLIFLPVQRLSGAELDGDSDTHVFGDNSAEDLLMVVGMLEAEMVKPRRERERSPLVGLRRPPELAIDIKQRLWNVRAQAKGSSPLA